MEKGQFKPRLFFFGDSFVQWHEPSSGHWTERFSNEYEVYRLGSSGASNDSIVSQVGVLPEYRPGDRIVFVLTEPSRLSKWLHSVSNPNLTSTTESIENTGWTSVFNSSYKDRLEEEKLLHSLFKIRILKDRLIRNEFEGDYHKYLDTPLQTYNLFRLYNSILSEYKPIFVTWSVELFDLNLLGNLLHLIPRGSYSTVIEENPDAHELDHHPGKQGGAVWHDRVRNLLDEWTPLEIEVLKVGTNYFDTNTSYIKRGPSIAPYVP